MACIIRPHSRESAEWLKQALDSFHLIFIEQKAHYFEHLDLHGRVVAHSNGRHQIALPHQPHMEADATTHEIVTRLTNRSCKICLRRHQHARHVNLSGLLFKSEEEELCLAEVSDIS